MSVDHTKRFSDRVGTYVLYRPKYPAEVRELLERECGLDTKSFVADIGCGPGNLTELFLPTAACVYGVEPNHEMREAGQKLLQAHANFVSVDGTAEATTLPNASVDFITAGQAFHWFDQGKAKEEFRRILRPGGSVALIWNDRLTDESPFLQEYESLLESHAGEYRTVNHRNKTEASMREFMLPAEMKLATFCNAQQLNLAGLKGRVESSSYVPLTGEGHRNLMLGLEQLFDKYKEDEAVSFLYRTEVYYATWP
ncbi:MAG TPA: class I SAM-dependent methyltransferase [Fimbriimonas sp.]|nr:class I SAM-dependent methyltransferase [Fimbriimonas sp.]